MSSSSAPCYVCTMCLHPCPSLFTSTPSLIQLTRCSSCGSVVDEYVEHEPLLVVVDALIQRPKVFRHVVFNRYANRRIGAKEVIKYLASVSLLEGYLSYQASPTSLTSGDFWLHCSHALVSCALFAGSAGAAGAAAAGGGGQAARGMFLALALPAAAKVAAVVLLIWAEEGGGGGGGVAQCT